MLFKHWLGDCLKQLIQLFEATLPRADQIFDLNKQTRRIWKTVVAIHTVYCKSSYPQKRKKDACVL